MRYIWLVRVDSIEACTFNVKSGVGGGMGGWVGVERVCICPVID